MSEELRDIMLSGFSIYPSNGKFIVKKQSVPHSDFTVDEKECDTYAEAIDFSSSILKKPRTIFWSGIVRFNRGLGVEYKNINDIEAETYESAVNLAEIQFNNMLNNQKIIISEIRVRLKK
jgi:hypothetical protein